MRVGIDLDDDTVGNRCIDHLLQVDLVRLAPQKDTPSRMTKHNSRRMLNRANHPLSHLLFRLAKTRVDRHHCVIQRIERRIF